MSLRLLPIRLLANRPRSSRSAQRGSALLASLVAVVVMSVLCASFLQLGSRATAEQSAGIDDLSALYLAEAGLTEAYNGLYQGKNGVVGSADEPAAFGHGVYWVEAENLGRGRVRLKSTGLVGAGRRALELVVQANQTSVTSLGVFGDEQLILEDSSAIDWYDSGAGSYEEQQGGAPSGNGSVGSNGEVVLGSSASIDGDCTPGVGFTVDLGAGASISGSTAPGSALTSMEAVATPELPSDGDLSVGGGGETIEPGERHYGAVTVPAGTTLTLAGPLELVMDSLDVAGDLVFDTTNGPVVLYVAGDTLLQAGSTLTTSDSDPTLVSVYLLGDNVTPVSTSSVLSVLGGGTTGASFQLGSVGLLGGGSGGSSGGGGLLGLGDVLSSVSAAWEDFGWLPVGSGAPPAHTIELDAGGNFHGFLYAPFASLSLPNGLHVFGGAVARRVKLEAGSVLSLDEQLLNGTAAGTLRLDVISWAVDDLPDVDLVKQRTDPLAQLARLGITPLASSEAHEQKAFAIRFKDYEGITREFKGVEQLFNWSAVDEVLDIYREGEVATDAFPHVDANALIPSTAQKQTSGTAFYYGRAPKAGDGLGDLLDAVGAAAASALDLLAP